MSLVVAQATSQGARIISDTRVTLSDDHRTSFKTGTLKAILIAPEIAVCFAGDVVAGLSATRDADRYVRAGGTVDGLLGRLHDATAQDRRSVEFIVATGDLQAQLHRVTTHGVEKNLPTAWIGAQAGFEVFQRARQAMPPPVESLPVGAAVLLQLWRAMDAVIGDPSVGDVNDFSVACAYKAGGFQYMESGFVHVGRDFPLLLGADLIRQMARPVEEGGYAVCIVEPVEPGTPALGLCFPVAKIGMVYLPLQHDEAQVFIDVSPNDFVDVVQRRLGVAFKNPSLRYG